MRRVMDWRRIAIGAAVTLLLIAGASRATAAIEPVRVVQAQIVERMFDEAGQEYALRCENQQPRNWDDQARAELGLEVSNG